MPDSPDYSKYLLGSVRFSVQDLGELAARLGSVDVLERRGDVIFMDDFSCGLAKWDSLPQGTGSAVNLLGVNVGLGRFAVQLIGGSGPPGNAAIQRNFSIPSRGKIGIEAGFVDGEEIDFAQVEFRYGIDDNLYEGVLRLDFTNSQVKYLNSAGGYTILDTYYELVGGNDNAVFIKFVVDITNHDYVRAQIGRRTYALTDIAVQTISAYTYENFRVTVLLNSNTGLNGIGYVTHVILTANEP